MTTERSLAERLARLVPHWAEHCGEHVAEIAAWRTRAAAELGADGTLATQLLEAEQRLAAARDALLAACALLPHDHGHDHPHGHDHAHPHSHSHRP